jgi:ABC-2 type transport system permease protein
VQGVALTAAAVVRERERGNIEQILVTPIRPAELMIGKMVPVAFIAMINVLTILAAGVLWFRVPFQGNFWLFLWLAFLYVVSVLGLGLLISTVSQTQRQAFQLVAVVALVSALLAGFMFPRYTMPPIIRAAGNLFPVTYFVPIARGIITKGVGLAFFRGQVLALLVYAVVIVVVAARAFRTRLE